MADVTRASRARGAIWGVCVADALGGPVQFMAPGSFAPVVGLESIAIFGQPKGAYSDDGAMTLALAQTFIDARGAYDELASVRYFLEWLFQGRFSSAAHAWDVGVSTRRALTLWQAGMWEGGTWRRDAAAHQSATQDEVDRHLAREECSGNGSLMRIAPIGVVMCADRRAARAAARTQSALTHPARACVEACELYTDLLCRIMHGETKAGLAAAVHAFDLTHPALAARLAPYTTLSDWAAATPRGLRSSGWVVDTIEVALWGFFTHDTWTDGALAVVNRGGDADTAGAVYGGLAGAFYGDAAIPPAWIRAMQRPELIAAVAQGVAALHAPPDA